MTEKYKSKVEIAYDYILDKIKKGDYSHGDRIVVSQLSKGLSISDIPVREAVRLLESDGYAEVVPNQGAYISIMSKENLIHIFQIKGVLEGYASRLCVDNITHKTIIKLYKNIEQSEESFTVKAFEQISKLNYDFHMTMYECIPNKELYKIIAELWQKWRITQRVFSVAPEHTPTSIKEHKHIVKLLESHDYDALETFVREHKLKAGAAYAKQFDTRPLHGDFSGK